MSETKRDTIEIPTANRVFMSIERSKKRQQVIATAADNRK